MIRKMSETEIICKQLCGSIDIIMSEMSGISERNTANQLIEQFKCNSNVFTVLNVSIKLLNETNDDKNSILYKHFGLQLLEHVIKFGWNSIDSSLKQQIKDLIIKWFDFNNNSIELMTKSRHLMNGSSRCVIEVLMREWPQNWPQFMSHLLRRENSLSLFVIWQLAEDLGVFYLPNNPQRRREMNNEFVNNINQIYSYISKCLMSPHFELRLISLQTLNGLLEWTQFDQNLFNILLQILCSDYNNSNNKLIQLKQLVCDCLLLCLNRKPLKLNDKTAIQTLFTDSNINQMVNIVRHYLQSNNEELENNAFVKRVILVYSAIGQQMVTLSNIDNISKESWTQYLQLMLSLFSHQNLVYNSISVQFWFCCLKQHNEFYKNQSFDKSLLLSILSLIPHKLMRQDYNKSLLGFEFDNSDDYDSFYIKFRADTIDLLRQLTVIDEKICFQFVSESLNTALMQSNNNRTDWEIIAQLCAAVYNKISDINQFQVESNTLLQLMIDKNNTEDPNLISSQLSCISALTVFFPQISRQLLNEIIKKIFILASFTLPGQTKSTRTKEVKNLRRHACSFFIKISQTYPSLLLPLFFDLKSHIDMVSLDVDQLSQMERCTLYEGLILISNEFEDIEVQKKFIQSLIEPINWIINYNISVEQFISEIGLDVNSTDEILGQKRANILFVVNLILGLLKRIKVNRKPSLLPHLLPLINGLLPLICNLNTIWKPEYQERCHEYHRSLVYSNVTETDRMNVLDIPLNSINIEHNLSEKSDAYRMQTFIWSLHENCYCVLGVATAVMTPEIYDYIYDFKPVLNDLQFLPDWKLKMIVKTFLKPLITNCPISQIYFEKILLPIISNVFPFLFNKINEKWDAIKVRNQCSEEEGMKDDSEPVESELLSDQLNRLLSREFVELLICVLNSSKANDSSLLTIDDNIGSNDVSDSNNSISELGNYLLQTIPDLIIVFVAKSLSWLDTTLSIKTSQLNLLVLEKIIKDGMIRSEDGVYFLFEQIITALSYFGEHEQNQSILLQLMLILYEGITIKLGFNSIKLKLSEISGSDIREWNDFDDKLIKSKGKLHFTDKKKKDLLRKLLLNVIGKNIGQLHKYNKVEIKNLQPMFYRKRNQIQNDFDDDIAICLLFNNS